jgi:hypothetical protein
MAGRRGLGRNALGDHLFRDHALATAAAAGATAFDDRLTATAAAIGSDFTTAAAISSDFATAAAISSTGITGHRLFAVALVTVLAEQTVALLPLAVAAMETGKQTTVATTMAAVTGDRTRVTADEGDGHERKKHCESKTEKTLHH